MKWLRFPVAGLFLSLGVMSVCGGNESSRQPNTLTPDQIAKGWIKAFDGKTTAGWKIDGEVKVIEGILILGGTRRTKAVLAKQLGDEFEFIYDSRNLGEKTHQLEIKGSLCGHSAGGGDANETHRAWMTQRIKSFYDGNRHVANWYLWYNGRWVGPGGSSAAVSERRGAFQLSLDIAAGSRVEIRNFKFRPMRTKDKKQDKRDRESN